MKSILYVLVALALIGGAYYLLFMMGDDSSEGNNVLSDNPAYGGAQELGGEGTTSDTPTTTAQQTPEEKAVTVIGKSVNGNEITAYHFGDGENEILLVGGIHGGYEWNTSLLMYEVIDYLKNNESTVIPENIKVTIVPVMNPDGLSETTGKTGRFSIADVPTAEGATIPGRFNGNEVDLNRNFDCDWQSSAKWRDVTVDGGTSAFSEPESKAVRDYIVNNSPTAVVVYYSSAGGVFASNCHDGVLPETSRLTQLYAEASGYKMYEQFNFYEITGDMVNWLAKERIPAISVLLTTHEDTEWTKNKNGIEAILNTYAQ